MVPPGSTAHSSFCLMYRQYSARYYKVQSTNHSCHTSVFSLHVQGRGAAIRPAYTVVQRTTPGYVQRELGGLTWAGRKP